MRKQGMIVHVLSLHGKQFGTYVAQEPCIYNLCLF